MRAVSAQRAAEAREQAEQLRMRIAVLGAVHPERTSSANAGAPSIRDDQGDVELRKVRAELRGMTAERDRLLNSTAWRATWPLRAAAERMPRSLRAAGRRFLSAAWWLATGQLKSRLRARRRILKDVAAVANSPNSMRAGT